jgi:hypothetical protein
MSSIPATSGITGRMGAMAAEERLAAGEQSRPAAERPPPAQLAVVAASQPVAQAVAGHRAGEGPGERGGEIHRAGGDQGADAEHQHHARNKQPDDGQRLAHGDGEHRQPRERRVGAEPVEQRLEKDAIHGHGGVSGYQGSHTPEVL